MTEAKAYVRCFEELRSDDVSVVGGKNASLGEMIHALKKEKIRVPDGFATTADAYREFLEANALAEKIRDQLDKLDRGKPPLHKTGKAIRSLFLRAEFWAPFTDAIRQAYGDLCNRYKTDEVDVAVGSSATAGQTRTQVMINIASPAAAFRCGACPARGSAWRAWSAS